MVTRISERASDQPGTVGSGPRHRLPVVLALIPGPAINNPSTFTARQITRLVESGCSVQIEYLESRTRLGYLFSRLVEIRRRIASSEAGLIHAHFGTVTAAFAAILSLITGRPLVVTFHGSDLNKTRASDGFARDLGQRLLSNIAALRAKRIICVSKKVLSALWWGRRKATVIPSGIDVEAFRPLDRVHCRRRLGWRDDLHYIVFNNGNGSRVKRQDIAEATIGLVAQKRPVELAVIRGVKYEEIPILLNAADCLLLCSDSEGSPTIIKEAMACGLPIVAVDVGDVAENITGISGNHITTRNPVDLAAAVELVLARGGRVDSRGRVLGRLDDITTSNAVLECYRRTVLSEGSDKAP